MTRAGPPRRRVSLELKVVATLLVIASVPLVVSAILIDQTGTVAHNFASNEAAFLRPPLEKAQAVYRELFETKRELYYHQAALRMAATPAVADLARGHGDADALEPWFDDLPELHRITVLAPDGQIVAQRERLAPVGVDTARWRPLTVEEPIVVSGRAASAGPGTGDGGAVALTFAASLTLQEDYLALGVALRGARRIDEVRSALPTSYRNAFWILVGGVIVVVSATGIILARRLTRRIAILVAATRQVAAGDLEARAVMKGRDELAELGVAFNRMVEELAHDRDQIAYLQRVGAWQDVARKLAHEIKNPLTPIQLAVQQCVSAYKGDDDRYRNLLRDAGEIVTEEISSLRRLVDAFRTLGKLPRVEAAPLDLAVVVDDLTRDPDLADHLALDPPPDEVQVRGDRLLLRRVLTNLVENAIQAGAAADAGEAVAGADGAVAGSVTGTVAIGWRADAATGRAVVTVDDHGAGVPADARDRIFEPYVTTKDEGTGLGLAICKKIALEHGGSLTVSDDPAPTGGARFVLSLPLAGAADADGEPSSGRA